MQNKIIWALLDERPGNNNQTLAVAEALGCNFVEKKLQFNKLIKLPSFITAKSLIGLNQTSHKLITTPFPDILIATGRKLSLVAAYVKHKNPQTFVVQIMATGKHCNDFDLIAAPQHDNAKPASNVITTLGSPHRVTPQKLAAEAAKFQTQITHLPQPRIAVLVGGSIRSHKFSERNGVALATFANNIAKSLDGSLMISTSRRTEPQVGEKIAATITSPNYFYRWNPKDSSEQNPFYALLGLADIIIVTGDSISMCSESCASGKPVFIYAPSDFIPPKHQQFLDSLFEQNFAKRLEDYSDSLPFTPPAPLNEAKMIAERILEHYRVR